MSEDNHLISWPDYGLIATRGKRLTFINLTGEEKAKCVDMKLDADVTPYVLNDKLFLHENSKKGNLYYFLASDLLRATIELKKRYLAVRQALNFGVSLDFAWLTDPEKIFRLYSVSDEASSLMRPIFNMDVYLVKIGLDEDGNELNEEEQPSTDSNRFAVNNMVLRVVEIGGGIERHDYYFSVDDNFQLLFLLQFYTSKLTKPKEKTFELKFKAEITDDSRMMTCRINFQTPFGYFGMKHELKPSLSKVYDFDLLLGVEFISEIRMINNMLFISTEHGNYMITIDDKTVITLTKESIDLINVEEYIGFITPAFSFVDDPNFNLLSVKDCPPERMTRTIEVRKSQILPLKYLSPIVNPRTQQVVALFGIESDLARSRIDLIELKKMDVSIMGKPKAGKKLSEEERARVIKWDEEFRNEELRKMNLVEEKLRKIGGDSLTHLFLPCNKDGLLYQLTREKLKLLVRKLDKPKGFVSMAVTTYDDMVAYINSDNEVIMSRIKDVKNGIDSFSFMAFN